MGAGAPRSGDPAARVRWRIPSQRAVGTRVRGRYRASARRATHPAAPQARTVRRSGVPWGVPRTAGRAPLLRAAAKNGNLGSAALSVAAIHQTIRRSAGHAGCDPAALSTLAGHRLRAGLVTKGTSNGAEGSSIARQTGGASLDSVKIYRRERLPLLGNAISDLGFGERCMTSSGLAF